MPTRARTNGGGAKAKPTGKPYQQSTAISGLCIFKVALEVVCCVPLCMTACAHTWLTRHIT